MEQSEGSVESAGMKEGKTYNNGHALQQHPAVSPDYPVAERHQGVGEQPRSFIQDLAGIDAIGIGFD